MGQVDFPFEAVIFDMDGVLVDSEIKYMHDEVEFFSDYGIQMRVEDLYETAGSSYQDFCELVRSQLATVGIDLTPDGAWKAYKDWESGRAWDYAEILNPGVIETLAELRQRGVRIALASSSPSESIELALSQCDLAGYFEFYISGRDFHESKPNPAIYLCAIERLGLSAESCCCVEDSLPGITAGKAAGLTVFAKREERFGFSQDAADVVIDQISDILSAAFEFRG